MTPAKVVPIQEANAWVRFMNVGRMLTRVTENPSALSQSDMYDSQYEAWIMHLRWVSEGFNIFSTDIGARQATLRSGRRHLHVSGHADPPHRPGQGRLDCLPGDLRLFTLWQSSLGQLELFLLEEPSARGSWQAGEEGKPDERDGKGWSLVSVLTNDGIQS